MSSARSKSRSSLSHHVFQGERLTAFSDAIFAIIATIMVIPLKVDDSFGESEFDLGIKFVLYFYTFALIIELWYTHNRIFRLIEHVDDLITCLNLVLLLLISFLPAAGVLLIYFTDEPLALTILASTVLLIYLIMIIMLFFTFRQQNILHPSVTKVIEMRYLKALMYGSMTFTPILCLLVIILTWTIPNGGIVLGIFLIAYIIIFIIRFVIFLAQDLYFKYKKNVVISTIVRQLLTKSAVTKERILAFSDGMFSIVGTLIVLDITTVDIFENCKDLGKCNKTIYEFFEHDQAVFLSYISSFMVVGLLWFNHHSMFHFIKNVTSGVIVSNSLSLLFIGLIPYGASLLSDFTGPSSSIDNRVFAVQVFSFILVVCSSCQLLTWAFAHCSRDFCLDDEVNNRSIEFIQLWKLLIFPITGLLFYFVTFSPDIIKSHFMRYFIYALPILFILPRITISLCRCIIRSKIAYHKRDISFISVGYDRVQIQGENDDEQVEFEREQEKKYLTTDTFANNETFEDSIQEQTKGFIV